MNQFVSKPKAQKILCFFCLRALKSEQGIPIESEFYKLRDSYIPVIRLHDKLDVNDAKTDLAERLLVVIEYSRVRAGVF